MEANQNKWPITDERHSTSMTNMHRTTARLKSLLWLGVVPGGRQQQQLLAAFSEISSEPEDPTASVLLLRRQEKKENGGWQDMQIVPPPKERERSFPPAECERVLPLSHTHTHTHTHNRGLLNGTLSLDTYWSACTHKPHNHINTYINSRK